MCYFTFFLRLIQEGCGAKVTYWAVEPAVEHVLLHFLLAPDPGGLRGQGHLLGLQAYRLGSGVQGHLQTLYPAGLRSSLEERGSEAAAEALTRRVMGPGSLDWAASSSLEEWGSRASAEASNPPVSAREGGVAGTGTSNASQGRALIQALASWAPWEASQSISVSIGSLSIDWDFGVGRETAGIFAGEGSASKEVQCCVWGTTD